MKIGKATVPRTAIATSDEHTIVVRGRDLSKELIGKLSFVEHFFLLLTGQTPSAAASIVRPARTSASISLSMRPAVSDEPSTTEPQPRMPAATAPCIASGAAA